MYEHLQPELINFLLVAVFSFLIGLEQRRLHLDLDPESTFGTDRTFTLVGILGYILYVASPTNLMLFVSGFAVVSVLLSVFYFMKIKQKQLFGLTSIVTALVTYCLAPLVFTQPIWLVLLVVVCILVLTEIKEGLWDFSKRIDNGEFITLAKFLVLAGVILPLLPDSPISPAINVSPYKMWLAIVVVSVISYLSYLLKKFVFPKGDVLLTAVLGGLYSSTATTIILARKSKEELANEPVVPAIILATTMMYIRVLAVAFVFKAEVAMALLPWFGAFVAVSLAIVFVILKIDKRKSNPAKAAVVEAPRNPLEFKTALLFGALFIFFAIVTNFVVKLYGAKGVNSLAYIVGVTDIDPFIINLFQQKPGFETSMVAVAVINAVSSNNLLKLIYAFALSNKALRRQLIMGFGILIVLGVAAGIVYPFVAQ